MAGRTLREPPLGAQSLPSTSPTMKHAKPKPSTISKLKLRSPLGEPSRGENSHEQFGLVAVGQLQEGADGHRTGRPTASRTMAKTGSQTSDAGGAAGHEHSHRVGATASRVTVYVRWTAEHQPRAQSNICC